MRQQQALGQAGVPTGEVHSYLVGHASVLTQDRTPALGDGAKPPASTGPADGGFLIPEELRSDLLQLAMEDTIVRWRAQVIPMSSLALPIPTVDETSRVSSLFGGIIAYWTEEGAAATESQARFGAVRLEAKKLVIYCEAP